MQLRIPGPTPCPEEVLSSLSRQMINHRGEEFAELIWNLTERLKNIFMTKGDVFILTSSGTGAMEASIVNTLSPGDRVLALSNGFFGERFSGVASAFGAEVLKLDFEWGKAIEPEKVRDVLKKERDIKAVLVVHNETSTGLTNPLKEIARVVREYDRLLLVDAISSLSCIELPMDEWGCDVVFTGSQKGFMVPPGLSFIAINERGWEAYKEAKMPKFYWDLGKAKSFLEKGQTPWTPSIPIFFALDVALRLIEKEGLRNIFERHKRVADKVREGIKELGLSLFPDERYASNTITAVRSPDGLDTRELLKILREEYDVVLAGGQERLSGKIFRIGHLGKVSEADMDEVLRAIGSALSKMGR